MGIDTIQRQFSSLTNARSLMLEGIQSNNLAIIDNCFSKEKIYSQFTYKWIEFSYQESIKKKSSLPQNFQTVVQSFIHHLEKDICKLGVYLFIHHVEIHPEEYWTQTLKEIKDIWLANFNDNSKNTDKLKASLHVDDILFDCEEILTRNFENKKEFIEKDLRIFIENTLPDYISILKDKDNEFKMDLINQFKKLKDLMLNGEQDHAKKQLGNIRQLLS